MSDATRPPNREVHDPQPGSRPSRTGLGVLVLLAALAAAVALAAPATADTPAGFVERPQLERIVSSVAGRPIQVFCARDLDAWGTLVWQSVGSDAALVDEDGLTQAAQGLAYLPSDTCRVLLDRLDGYTWPLPTLATAILALLHESEHLAGVSNESTADCTALPLVPIVAITHFHYASRPKSKHRQLHNLVAFAWDRHQERPQSYQTLC
jgi:hypothetical protein